MNEEEYGLFKDEFKKALDKFYDKKNEQSTIHEANNIVLALICKYAWFGRDDPARCDNTKHPFHQKEGHSPTEDEKISMAKNINNLLEGNLYPVTPRLFVVRKISTLKPNKEHCAPDTKVYVTQVTYEQTKHTYGIIML